MRRPSVAFSVLCLFVLVVSRPSSVRAQLATATIYGAVADQSSARVPNAAVQVTNEGTNVMRTVMSDSSGDYVVPLLPVGTYTVQCSQAGFSQASVEHILLEINDRREVNFALQLSSVSSTVEATAQAPLLDTSVSSLGQVVHEENVQQLPLNGRNFVQLGILTAGATNSSLTYSASSTVTIRGDFSMSVNGMRVDDNDFYVDGVDNNQLTAGSIVAEPSIDAIQEFKVLSTNYSAQYGRNGGAVVLISTKSGTNQVHGTGYDFLRNTSLDARNAFATTNPPYHQNQFGASAGGPIRKNKVFFFGDYEGERLRQPTIQYATVPTPAEVAGNFAGINAIYNPLGSLGTYATRPEFPNDQIPASQISLIAQRILALYPAPNLPGAGNNYYSDLDRIYGTNKGDGRLDWVLSEKDSVYGSFSMENAENQQPGNIPNFPNNSKDTSNYARHLAVNETHIFSPTTLNTFTAGFSRLFAYNLASGQPNTEESNALGIPYSNLGDVDSSGMAEIDLSGFTSIGSSGVAPYHQISNTFQYSDNVALIRGRHSLNVGFALLAYQLNTDFSNQGVGDFGFNALFTSQVSGTSFVSKTGNPIASLMMGLPDSLDISHLIAGPTGRRAKDYRAYVQDDWKVNSRLTLNLGFAYEHMTPFTEIHNRMANFDLSTGMMLVAGVNATNAANVQPDWKDLQPRIGFAFQPANNWAIRGAYGVFNDFFQGGVQGPQENPPFYNEPTGSSDSITPITTLALGFPAPVAQNPNKPTGEVIYTDPNLRLARIQERNLTVERQLPGETLIRVAYVGMKADHLLANYSDIGYPVPGPGTIAARRAFPLVTELFSHQGSGYSNYNAMQVAFEKRVSHGLSALVNYTWGRSMDNSPPDNAASVGDTQSGVDYYPFAPQGAKSDYGRSYIDLKNNVAASAIYMLPFGRNQAVWKSAGSVANAFVGGWQWSVISRIRGGFPYGVSMSTSLQNNGQGNRPNVICNPYQGFTQSTHEWYNLSCYQQPAAYQFGNAGRSTGTGPDQVNFDMSLAKYFPIRESMKLQFRAEAFNVFNHTELSQPGTSIGSASAGTITSTSYAARILQVALKLFF